MHVETLPAANRLYAWVALCLSLLLSLTACIAPISPQAGMAKAPPEMTIDVSESGFQIPAQLTAGIAGITVKNSGKSHHQAVLLRLREGVSLDEFNAALAQGPDMALPKVYIVREGEVEPGARSHEIHNLKAGQYVALDTSGEQPTIQPFLVGAATGQPVAEPAADVKVQQVDFSFNLPDQVQAGHQTWMIENKGTQWHEMAIIKAHPGVTVEDLIAVLEGQARQSEPPMDVVAMWPPMSEGEQVWVELDLPPGDYMVICTLTDGKDGKSHLAHGMVHMLKVVS